MASIKIERVLYVKTKIFTNGLSFALVISLLMSVMPIALAATEIEENVEITEEEISDTYLGTIFEDEGFSRIYHDDDAISPVPLSSEAYSLMFSMSIGTIYDLLTSYAAGKSFTRGSLTNDYMTVSGKLVHSSGSSIKVGACYLSNGIFQTQTYAYFGSNVQTVSSNYYTYYGGSTTYYGFVKNDSGISGSYVTGSTSLSFYNGNFQ